MGRARCVGQVDVKLFPPSKILPPQRLSLFHFENGEMKELVRAECACSALRLRPARTLVSHVSTSPVGFLSSHVCTWADGVGVGYVSCAVRVAAVPGRSRHPQPAGVDWGGGARGH